MYCFTKKKYIIIKKITILLFLMFKFKIFANENTLKKIGITLKELLTNLGHLFTKIGQLLSTRHDVFPEQIINELKKLREYNEPIESSIIIDILEKNYKKKINLIFSNFNKKPLATGSIAQIHEGILKNTKKKIVVKIIKPNIYKKTKVTLYILKLCLIFFVFLFKTNITKNYILKLLDQLEEKLLTEINLNNEIKNAFKLKKNFKHNKYITIPKMYKKLSNKNIIVMDKMYGIPIDSIAILKKHNFNLKKIATLFIEFFFLQVFRDNFFHADLHPGNVWIVKKKNNFKFIILDFGIMGALTKEDQSYIIKNILAFTTKNYKEVAKLHLTTGFMTEKKYLKDLEKNIKNIFAPIIDKPLQQIPFRITAKKIATLLKKYDMKVKPQFFLFQKTFLTVEGLSRYIYPNLCITPIIKPIAKRWGISNINLIDSFKSLNKKILRSLTNNKLKKTIIKKQTQHIDIVYIIIYIYVVSIFYFTTTI